MTRKPFEVFEHTAEVGLHAYGETLPELFCNAARGMESLLVPPEQVHVVTSREITVEGHDSVSLLCYTQLGPYGKELAPLKPDDTWKSRRERSGYTKNTQLLATPS